MPKYEPYRIYYMADGKEHFLESHEHEHQVLKATKILCDHDMANGRPANRFYWRYEPK